MALEITTANFEQEVTNSTQTVLVDFLGILVRPLPYASSDFGSLCSGAQRYQDYQMQR